MVDDENATPLTRGQGTFFTKLCARKGVRVNQLRPIASFGVLVPPFSTKWSGVTPTGEEHPDQKTSLIP